MPWVPTLYMGIRQSELSFEVLGEHEAKQFPNVILFRPLGVV